MALKSICCFPACRPQRWGRRLSGSYWAAVERTDDMVAGVTDDLSPCGSAAVGAVVARQPKVPIEVPCSTWMPSEIVSGISLVVDGRRDTLRDRRAEPRPCSSSIVVCRNFRPAISRCRCHHHCRTARSWQNISLLFNLPRTRASANAIVQALSDPFLDITTNACVVARVIVSLLSTRDRAPFQLLLCILVRFHAWFVFLSPPWFLHDS